MVPQTGSCRVPVSNVQSQGSSFSGGLSLTDTEVRERGGTEGRVRAQRCTLGRPECVQNVVWSWEGWRTRGGCGRVPVLERLWSWARKCTGPCRVQAARSGPQGPGGAEATHQPTTRPQRRQPCPSSGAGGSFSLPQAPHGSLGGWARVT